MTPSGQVLTAIALTVVLVAPAIARATEPEPQYDPSQPCVMLEDDEAIARRQRAADLTKSGGEAMIRGDLERAFSSFEEAFRLAPDNAEARMRMAEALIHRGDHAQAIEVLAPLDTERPAWGIVGTLRAIAQVGLGRLDDALATWGGVAADHPDDERLADRFSAALLGTDRDRAIALMEQMVEARSTWMVIRSRLAATLFAAGRLADAFGHDLEMARRQYQAPQLAFRLVREAARVDGGPARLEAIRGETDAAVYDTAQAGLLLEAGRAREAAALLDSLANRRESDRLSLSTCYHYFRARTQLALGDSVSALTSFGLATAGETPLYRGFWLEVGAAAEALPGSTFSMDLYRRIVQASEQYGIDDDITRDAAARLNRLMTM